MYNLIVQGIGILGFVLTVIAFQINNRKWILYLLLVGNLMFGIHLYFLNSLTGSTMRVISIFRAYMFSQRTNKKWLDNQAVMYLFIVIFFISGIITWKEKFSLFPIVATIIQTVALWMKSTRKMRLICLVGSPLWLIYNIHSGSIAGILTETFVSASIIFAIIRFEVLKKNNI
jgi:hypothetical protein